MTTDIAEIASAYTAAWNSGSAEAVASFLPRKAISSSIAAHLGWAVRASP